MRILFWNHSFLPTMAGVEIFTARLAAGLIARGHEAMVLTVRHPDTLPEDEMLGGVRVRRFAFLEALASGGRNPLAGLRLIHHITSAVADLKRDFRPDVVHVNLADASPLFHLRTLEAHPCATVVTLQSALLQRSVGADNLTARLLRQAAHVVAVSSASAANIAAFTDINPADIAVIAPGIPADEFAPSPAGRASPEPVFAFLGRLVADKGADIAIDAIALLGGAARLRIIGDGVERGRLRALACERGVEDLVRFEGAVDDGERRRLLSDSMAMLVPSLHEELFGMVAVEGALSGLPVIASAIGGLQEIVQPGRTGLLCPPGDAGALAHAMRTLLGDPARVRRMGEAGRARALAHYTIEQTVERYEELYASVSARQPV